MPEHITVSEVENNIATLTLNRPEKKNALSIALRNEVSDALDALAANEDVKVVIVTGTGGIFSAGFDLTEFQQAAGDTSFHDKLWLSSDRFHQTFINFPLPLIAAINGPAIAGGFDVATMCDIRIATPDAWFSHPEIAFGPVIYSLLHDLIGGSTARDLCLTGRKVDADEALALRLISRIVPADQLATEAAATATQTAQAPREHLLGTKAKIIARAGIAQGGTLEL